MVDTLKDLALRVCANFPESTYIQESLGNDEICLKDGVYLPQDLCEPLFETMLETRPLNYLSVFRDHTRCRLTKLKLKEKKTIRHQKLLSELLNHRVREINFSNCFLHMNTASKFAKLSGCLESLYLSGTRGSWPQDGAKFLSELEKLKLLDVSFCIISLDCMNSISNMKSLTHLDISGCTIDSIVPLLHLKGTMEQLYMYNVNMKSGNEILDVIPELKALTHLDISRDVTVSEDELVQKFIDPISKSQLMKLFGELKELIYLDISGFTDLKESDLENLKGSLQKDLEFLGLFGTFLEFHRDLPAKCVSGFANDAQILTALRFHAKRPFYMRKALGTGYDLLSQRNFECCEEALKLIVAVSREHLSSDNIQLASSACICHLLVSTQAANFSREARRSTIIALLNVMEAHKLTSVLKNCLQCLCNFNFPSEMEFAFDRLGKQLLRILKEYSDQRLCRLAITFFNAIICHSSWMKLQIGKLGAVNIILDVIRVKINNSEIDRILDTCWCALWNVTDETPENCEAFIYSGGLDLFQQCLNEFENDTELQRSMLGLMGNLAEVESLRCHFRVDEMLRIFIKLLDTSSYDFEVSYNAGGVLSHVCSDGDEEWQSNEISRQECMDAVINSVQKWSVESSRNINYRSLLPILRLVPLEFNQCGQVWSIWALANLTKVYPQKYCEILVKEGGKELLNGVLESEAASENMKSFVQMIMSAIADCEGAMNT